MNGGMARVELCIILRTIYGHLLLHALQIWATLCAQSAHEHLVLVFISHIAHIVYIRQHARPIMHAHLYTCIRKLYAQTYVCTYVR